MKKGKKKNKYYFLNGKTLEAYHSPNIPWHREDGPAVEYSNGTKLWCRSGLLHREDGPAYERRDVEEEYYIEGIRIDKYIGFAISMISDKEDIVEYLLSDDPGIRLFAEYRLKKIDEEMTSHIFSLKKQADLLEFLLDKDKYIRLLATFKFKELNNGEIQVSQNTSSSMVSGSFC